MNADLGGEDSRWLIDIGFSRPAPADDGLRIRRIPRAEWPDDLQAIAPA
jgi:hypothetical protein